MNENALSMMFEAEGGEDAWLRIENENGYTARDLFESGLEALEILDEASNLDLPLSCSTLPKPFQRRNSKKRIST